MNETEARERLETAEKLQTLRAMERLVLKLGGKKEYIAWLGAMPDDADFSKIGHMRDDSLRQIAQDPARYENAGKVFAKAMGPVLQEMASE